MPFYPSELTLAEDEGFPSFVRLTVASMFVMMAIGEWGGQDLTGVSISSFFLEQRREETAGWEFEHKPHELASAALSPFLEKARNGVTASLIASIEKGDLRPALLRRSIQGSVNANETWISTAKLSAWCSEREIDLSEDFYEYVAEEQKISWAGHEAFSNARYKAEHSTQIRKISESGHKGGWKERYLELVESRNEESEARSKYNASHQSLETRERNVLLTIIAVLCREQKLDYTKHAKSAGLISEMANRVGLKVSESAIENHLRRVPAAVESRSK